jgi:hypothetical protein
MSWKRLGLGSSRFLLWEKYAVGTFHSKTITRDIGWFYDGAERRLSRDGLDYLRRCPRSGLDEERIWECLRLSPALASL